jgi:Cof subfamily protein (haloacid dehalogenase superfamily)
MIRCIASDMDGTLINSRQTISEANREAILKAQQEGIQVVIATGRSYEEARYVLQEAGIHTPIICVNGAEVRDQNGTVVHVHSLDKKDAQEIMNILKEIDIYFELYTNKGTFTENYEIGLQTVIDIFTTTNPPMPEEFVRQMAKERLEKGFIREIGSYSDIMSDNEIHIYKFLVFSADKEKLQLAHQRLQPISSIAISSSGSENLEITDQKAQKGVALKKFVEQQGIALEETMAIGDNYNDVSMFNIVGYPVAMGNALDDIKKQCRYETATNDEDGVAKAIEMALQKVGK